MDLNVQRSLQIHLQKVEATSARDFAALCSNQEIGRHRTRRQIGQDTRISHNTRLLRNDEINLQRFLEVATGFFEPARDLVPMPVNQEAPQHNDVRLPRHDGVRLPRNAAGRQPRNVAGRQPRNAAGRPREQRAGLNNPHVIAADAPVVAADIPVIAAEEPPI
ncbi:hypothetical protein OUZ56_009503 [Daphnia magna]|uniref:Uncharacterized protein n=1 Tax=Daphnia magna TaxID=35525 RepID=A0ABR0AGF2_9CRUS|nr:hypothetical protein OUZ56_009503 [Daphnia magna]